MPTKILVVDDSNTIQKVIRIALSKFALDVVAAGSYAEALSIIGDVQPDVVLADCALIGTKAPKDFTRLAMDAGGAPIILLVGSYEDFDESAFRASGFKVFVHKPFESSDIVKAVGDALGAPLVFKKNAPPASGRGTDLPSNNAVPTPKPTAERSPAALVAEPVASSNKKLPPPPVFKPKAPSIPPPPSSATPKKSVESDRSGEEQSSFVSAPRERHFQMEDEDTSEIDRSRLDLHDSTNLPIERILQETQIMVARTIQTELEHQLPAQVEVAVRRYLETYLERHFKSLAKEILIAEIRRLTDEKARQAMEG